MRTALLPSFACVALLSGHAFAQAEFTFPMNVESIDSAAKTVTVTPDYAIFSQLMNNEQVVLHDMYLPGGELISVELERISIERRKYGFIVDGRVRNDLLDGLDLSIWKGTVVGSASSEVFLSFSREGSRGWVQRGTSVIHVMPQPDENGNWTRGSSVLVSEQTLNDNGSKLDGFCEYDRVSGTLGERTVTPPRNPLQDDIDGEGFVNQQLGSCTIRECTIAIETDYQLFQVFGSLGAETAYVTSLTAAASDRYEGEVSTTLTYPYVQFYTTSNDPWSTPEGGGSSVDMLYEFQAAWVGNIPTGARIGHFLSGAGLGGGVAWLDVLCNNTNNFSVSGNINGNVQFPVQQQPNNWDFIVFNHELGHNFGTPHTHDFCPPLDQCAPNGYFGQCQNAQVCTNSGTLMSYCHLCSGGTGNITTYFHPGAIGVMQPLVDSCLPLYSGLTVDAPTLISPTATTAVSATIVGNIIGNVELRYRYNGGSYQTLVMNNVSGNLYSADLPAANCGDSPEFYISYTNATCGAVTAPAGGATSPYTAVVGDATTAFSDNFESDLGWTTQNLGASSGDWQRGVPVNDGGWDYDPMSDGDGSGSAYLTENQTGNTDVDGGAVELYSPVIDMSGANITVSYQYFLRLTNDDGSDRLLVEASSNGAAGPWTTIATHDTNGGLNWRNASIDMSASGVTLGSNMMLRFTANDSGNQSIVEAGLDGLSVDSITCGGGGGPLAYCSSGGNSVSGLGAQLSHVSGTPGGVLTVQLDNVPTTPGILFFGPTQSDTAFGCGRLCISGQLTRSSVYSPGSNSFQAVWDTTGIASSPFNIQYWYRDPSNLISCGDVFNTSNALGY